MKQYFIKKSVYANNINEVISRESKAQITDIWTEEKKEDGANLTSAIGFDIPNHDDDE